MRILQRPFWVTWEVFSSMYACRLVSEGSELDLCGLYEVGYY